MPGFLYFVPGALNMGEAKAALEKAGAPHAVETVGRSGPMFNQISIPAAESAGGPAGSGYIVGREGFHLYNKKTQEWHRAPVLVEGYDGPGYWVGFERDAPPGPEELARQKQLAGHWVELADGKRWLAPVARLPIGEEGVPALPRVVKLGADRAKTMTVVASHRWLWDEACAFWDEWAAVCDEAAPQREEFTWVARSTEGRIVTRIDSCFDLACRALAVNYRLGPAEVSVLGLVTSENAADVPLALVDWPSDVELAKKAEASGGESSSPGATA